MTTTDLETFKRLYSSEFDVALTDEEAERQARLLSQLYLVVYGSPVIKANYGDK